MVLLLILAVAGNGADAATTAPVDPALVGTWKLAQPGLNMYWQIRADGSYRYFGVNARPFEHWGTMQASGGRWSSRWAGGTDGGSYTLSGNSWAETGNVGTGNWTRVWKPGDGVEGAVPAHRRGASRDRWSETPCRVALDRRIAR